MEADVHKKKNITCIILSFAPSGAAIVPVGEEAKDTVAVAEDEVETVERR
jgi:hypothetical protein